MLAKKKQDKWYHTKLFITIVSIVGSILLGIIPAYYFTIRAEKIEYSKIESGVLSTEDFLAQGLVDAALQKF